MPSSSMLNSLRREGGSLWYLSKPRLLAPWIRHSSQASRPYKSNRCLDSSRKPIHVIFHWINFPLWWINFTANPTRHAMRVLLMCHKNGWIFLLKTFRINKGAKHLKKTKAKISHLTSYRMGFVWGASPSSLNPPFIIGCPKPKSQHHNHPLEAHYLPFFSLFIRYWYWWFFKK